MSDEPYVVGTLLCQAPPDDPKDIAKHILRVHPFVDEYVIVDNGSSANVRAWLDDLAGSGLTLPSVRRVFREWNDSFADARNAYIEVIEVIAARIVPRPLVWASADVDELFSDELLRDLRKVARWMYLEDYNVLRVASRPVETDWEGKKIWSGALGWYKPMMFLWESGARYWDEPGHFHEDFKPPSGWRSTNLDDEDGLYRYDHIKPFGIIWLRALRNAFAGGGGPNLGERCPFWKPFRALVEARTGIRTSDRFVEYLRAGNIHSDIKSHFLGMRFLGTPHDSRTRLWDEWPDGTSEWREQMLAYFVYLHPEEMPPDVLEHDRALGIDYAPNVRAIHGPNAPEWAQTSRTS